MTGYDRLNRILQILQDTKEVNAFYMGAFEKLNSLCDNSSFAFTRLFAQLTSLTLITPEAWYDKQPSFTLRCDLKVLYPPQSFKLDIDVFKAESKLMLSNVEERGFMLTITSETQDQGILVFKIDEMPKAWKLIKEAETSLSESLTKKLEGDITSFLQRFSVLQNSLRQLIGR
jgi:hypothetical protein